MSSDICYYASHKTACTKARFRLRQMHAHKPGNPSALPERALITFESMGAGLPHEGVVPAWAIGSGRVEMARGSVVFRSYSACIPLVFRLYSSAISVIRCYNSQPRFGTRAWLRQQQWADHSDRRVLLPGFSAGRSRIDRTGPSHRLA
jgi:hypothetical protein